VKVNESYPMEGRKQKISKDTYLQKNRAELEGYVGGQTFMGITENNFTNVDLPKNGLLEQILSPLNLNAAYKQVKRNKGVGGIDKMEVEHLMAYLSANKEELLQSLMEGKYRPNPVRRVEIPKDNNKKRLLGIPTVVDRVIQQSISQVLSPIYEKQFSDHSYGFRIGRNAHQALRKCRSYISDGLKYAVDLDLEKYFDTVNHSKLIEILSRTIKDGRVISLIHKYLNSGVIISNKYEETRIGVPQGGPLSPLLSNIMLNELDKELDKRGHCYIRYADDLVILCRSKRSAERTLRSITSFIEDKLLLKVNRDKTIAANVKDIKFLGYSFYIFKGEGKLRIHPKSIAKLKESLKLLTSRSNGWGNENRKLKLRQFIMGWVNYFKLAQMNNLLKELDKWYRRRIRMLIWKQWKRVRTRGRNLMKLGLPKYKSWEYANTRKGYWCVAGSPILKRAITNEQLKQSGYLFLLDYYRKVRGIN
jgi:group II intron reverse transcriptase/maturase